MLHPKNAMGTLFAFLPLPAFASFAARTEPRPPHLGKSGNLIFSCVFQPGPYIFVKTPGRVFAIRSSGNEVSHFMHNLYPTLLFVILAFVLLALAKTFKPQIKGWFGEILLDRFLRRKLDPAKYRILHNIMIPTDDGATTQIDHIVVSQWGVFVIETKTYSGWIFGDAKSPQWTVTHFKRKNRFQNPLRQNYKHLATLSECLGVSPDLFKTVVAFSGEAQFKTEMPSEVLHFGDVANYILRQSSETLIPPEQVPEVEAVILEWQSSLSRDQKAAHVQNLRKNHPPAKTTPPSPSDGTSPVCPKCGAPMVLRTRRSDGGTFWGCTRFPSCRGICPNGEKHEASAFSKQG